MASPQDTPSERSHPAVRIAVQPSGHAGRVGDTFILTAFAHDEHLSESVRDVVPEFRRTIELCHVQASRTYSGKS